MKLNFFEYWLMNNPIRAMIQSQHEMRNFERLIDLPQGKCILEIGCGQGIGAKILSKRLKPVEYQGIDLDEKMIKRAKRRKIKKATFQTADATKLPFDSETFDLVFDFAIIHHIPNWEEALSEVFRVLKPGGMFLFEELSQETWKHGIGKPLKKVLEHPYEEMFDQQSFMSRLNDQFDLVDTKMKSACGFRYFYGIVKKHYNS